MAVYDWSVADWLYYVLREFVPFIMCIAIGSFFLWRHTKRRAALVQLVAAGMLLLSFLIDQVEYFISPFHQAAVWSFLRSEPLQIAKSVLLLLSTVLFGAGYVWYALGEKRI